MIPSTGPCLVFPLPQFNTYCCTYRISKISHSHRTEVLQQTLWHLSWWWLKVHVRAWAVRHSIPPPPHQCARAFFWHEARGYSTIPPQNASFTSNSTHSFPLEEVAVTLLHGTLISDPRTSCDLATVRSLTAPHSPSAKICSRDGIQQPAVNA